MKKKNLLCILLSLILCMVMLPAEAVSAATVLTENKQGTEDGYSYELWKDSGNTTMTLTGAGTFSCEWSNINNALFRRGMNFDSQKKTYKELGNISIDYEVDYQPNGNSYLCCYGWLRNPLVEYYIVESWGTWRPPNGQTGASDMQITVDGAVYDVYKTVREQQPSIEGTQTFYQYWSVRRPESKRTSGTINVSSHFAAWEELGFDMGGTLYEAALNVEGWQSSGKATVLKNEVSVGGEIVTPGPVDTEPDEPDADGYYFHSTFEKDTDGWDPRGDASITSADTAAFKGSKSLSVTGRTDSWNGAARSLGTATFQPGKAYSFSAVAMQDAAASEDFKLTLQYTNSEGEESYDTIAEATGSKGQWVQLANTSYTIPAGASNLLIYVETADSTTSFYMDEAIGAPEGTVIKENLPDVPDPDTKGDVNSDGKVDDKDVAALQSFLLGNTVSLDNDAADMDGNGRLNVFDLVLLKRAVKNGEGNSDNTDPPVVDTTAPPSIDPAKPMVAIAFDDGAVGTDPNSSSMRILNALNDSGFHATFFYVGNWIGNNQGEVRAAYDMGMEIANHTMSHPNLTEKSASEIRSEYDSCAQLLQSIIGTEPSKLMRLPYLASNSTVQSTLNDVPLISCSVDSQDWNGATSDQIIDKIKTAMNDGSLQNSIVLCHETYDSTAEAMEYLCPYLKSQGWQIVTISEMFEANGKTMNGGQIYTKCS